MREADEFFQGKRVWSVIKDQIVASYMRPYLAKVNRLGRPILLVDAFAGPGKFDDGTDGSPLLMCDAAERFAPRNYKAMFVNHSSKHHDRLKQVLIKQGYDSAIPIRGRAEDLLARLPSTLSDQTVLLYLDPFGLSGNDFALLEPFLKRNVKASTEIIVNVHMPIVHRLAARNAISGSHPRDRRIAAYHSRLSKTFGGDYWKEILWDESLTPNQREWYLIERYADKLRTYLDYVGFCPVREAEEKQIKYFVVSASRHMDSLILMNDIMARAYYGHIHRQATTGSLWENTPWATTQQMRIGGASVEDLAPLIMDMVKQHPGESREGIWLRILIQQFMRFTESEYNHTVKALIEAKCLRCPPDPKTKRINKTCPLYPV